MLHSPPPPDPGMTTSRRPLPSTTSSYVQYSRPSSPLQVYSSSVAIYIFSITMVTPLVTHPVAGSLATIPQSYFSVTPVTPMFTHPVAARWLPFFTLSCRRSSRLALIRATVLSAALASAPRLLSRPHDRRCGPVLLTVEDISPPPHSLVLPPSPHHSPPC